MKAVLLAAGQGRRLLPHTKEVPKALLRVSDRESIIEYQVRVLRDLGVSEIVAVVGYKKERVKEIFGNDLVYVENPLFDKTNSIYSAYLALRELGEDDVLILNADVLFDRRIVERLVLSGKDAVISVDSSAKLDDEAMKVKVRSGLVVDIRKDLPLREAYGENVGIVFFRKAALPDLFESVRRLVEMGAVREWFPRAFLEFIKKRPLYFVDVKGLSWIEIDFPEDLERAKVEVYPRLK